MFSQSTVVLYNALKAGNINHLQFLNASEYAADYQNWCLSIREAPTEENAELYFDMHGFDEMDVKSIIVESF